MRRQSRTVLPAAAALLSVWMVGAMPPWTSEEPTGTPAAAVDSGHRKMVKLLAEIAEQAKIDNPYQGRAQMDRASRELAGLPENDVPKRWFLNMYLGWNELRLGNEDRALEHYAEANRVLSRSTNQVPLQHRIRTLFETAVAHMRHGESRNCVEHHVSESCIFPIEGGGVHREPGPSRRAYDLLLQLLDVAPANDPARLRARWLLNIVAMTLGSYPAGVPEAHLIPSELFDSDEPFPRFEERAAERGLATVSLAGGAIVDDFTGDDRLDVIVSSMDTSGQLRFHVQGEDGRFTERTEAAGLNGLIGGLNVTHADYDNDGDLDLYIGNEGGQAVRFDDSQNRDVDAPGQLFRNEGNGRFVDVAAAAGVENRRFAKGVTWGDYDGDRYPDLYVSNGGYANRLYRNNRDGTFTDVAPELGVTHPLSSFPTFFWDVDNDGDLDLFVSAYGGRELDVATVAADYLGLGQGNEVDRLYINDGDGGFVERGAEWGLGGVTLAMGANHGDLDNDGWPDFYLGTGYPYYEGLIPNRMFRNKQGRGFADITTAGGFGHLQKGHGVVIADIDNDGDQDVFEQIGGAYPGDSYADVLFDNPGTENRWLKLSLIGKQSNRSGVGARVRADIEEENGRRSIHATVGSGGSFGANPMRVELGLGRAETIERLTVYWPTSDRTQSFEGLAVNRWFELEEGEELRERKAN